MLHFYAIEYACAAMDVGAFQQDYQLHCFDSREERDAWVAQGNPHIDQAGARQAIPWRRARQLDRGLAQGVEV